MTAKKTNDKGEVQSTSNTELQILANIEKAFYRNNEKATRRNTEDSLKWFSRYVPRSYSKVRSRQLFKDKSLQRTMISPGNMYFFEYDAKWKDKLPVWDRFPLIFPWDSWQGKDGATLFIGINLHYLPPRFRFVAMKALLKMRNQKRFRKGTRLIISWKILKNLSESKFFKHSVKMYRLDHVKSPFVQIPPSSWEMVLFLPLADWQKSGKRTAWKM